MPEIHDPSDFASFIRVIEHAQQTREDRIERYSRPILESGILPTPDDVREAINSLVGETRRRILRHHRFRRERTLRQGLDSLVRAAHQASIDVCRHDAALGALADSVDFQDHVELVVGHAAQKDVVAYCALAFGVRDTLSELQGLSAFAPNGRRERYPQLDPDRLHRCRTVASPLSRSLARVRRRDRLARDAPTPIAERPPLRALASDGPSSA